MTQLNAANPKDVKAANKAADEWELLAAQVLTGLMTTSTGRRWIWEILAECHVFDSTMTDTDRWTAFGEGRRSVGLGLLNRVLTTCPNYFIDAMRENHERHTIDAARQHAGGTPSDGRDSGPAGDTEYDGSDFEARFGPVSAHS